MKKLSGKEYKHAIACIKIHEKKILAVFSTKIFKQMWHLHLPLKD